MTKNSHLCNIIQNNPNTWRQIIEQKRIKIKEDGVLAIFNYDIKADFRDPVIQESRGIIINTNTATVVCWPFNKFGNYSENYAAKIDWNTARVLEKVDGSIVKLWFNELTGEWQWSTNACIDITYMKVIDSNYDKNAHENIYWLELIWATEEYSILSKAIKNNKLTKDNTYIFELVSPFNHVVIEYLEPRLYLIGIRNNHTGIESSISDISFEIRKPRYYDIHSFDDCIEAAKQLNNGTHPDNEGFVVVDAAFNRIKVKNPQYVVFHHGIFNVDMTAEQAYEISQFDDFDINMFREVASKPVADKLEYYLKRFDKVENEIKETVNNVIDLSCMRYSRKEIAEQLKGNKYSFYAFKALDDNLSAENVIKKYGIKTFLQAVS